MKRIPAVAGQFYPENPQKLQSDVNRFLGEAPIFKLPNIRALIVPRAGYIYSGKMAGVGYKQIVVSEGATTSSRLPKPFTFFTIGPAHYAYTDISVGDYDACETPLGEIKVDSAICRELKEKGIPFDEEAHRPEHCLEVQWPFIQVIFPESAVVPILYGNASPEALADILDPYFLRPDLFFIISSDLSHYLSYDEAVATDRNTLKIIESINLKKEREIDACGKIGIQAIMRLASRHGCQAKVLGYYNSGDVVSERSGVVGYSSIAIYKE